MVMKGMFRMDMNIAAMSVNMSQTQVQQDVGISALKKVYDQMESSTDMLSELSAGVSDSVGVNVDLSV
ncbi:YjfB family protein [Pectinatus brassicae]|uniref:Motility protein n=1 Tax=Pectinatus brassicae TaxID=862415 RepID=A0A840UJC6_9FIRM|nr:YjfB family protein [Pectinatus brassicae]MBB5335747.1 hypothetical protein [Pectinatus brassicae]